MAKARQFKEFLPAITAHPPRGEVVTVIGGQAINYWCEQAYRHHPALASYHPFTSADLDVVAQQREQTLAIAKATGLRLVEQEQGYASTDRAALVDTSGRTPQTVIQVLGGMYGVSNKELERDTAEISIVDQNGKTYTAKIANRTVLIKGKIALALAPDAVRSPEDKEHDRFHLRLLILCMAIATRELLEGIGTTHDERAVIKSLKALLKVIGGKPAAQVAAQDSGIIWPHAIAPEILAADSNFYPHLGNYVERELLPWIEGKKT